MSSLLSSTHGASPRPHRLHHLLRRIDRRTLIDLLKVVRLLRDPVLLVAIGIWQIWLMR
jgi:hypothetical protein